MSMIFVIFKQTMVPLKRKMYVLVSYIVIKTTSDLLFFGFFPDRKGIVSLGQPCRTQSRRFLPVEKMLHVVSSV